MGPHRRNTGFKKKLNKSDQISNAYIMGTDAPLHRFNDASWGHTARYAANVTSQKNVTIWEKKTGDQEILFPPHPQTISSTKTDMLLQHLKRHMGMRTRSPPPRLHHPDQVFEVCFSMWTVSTIYWLYIHISVETTRGRS